MEAKSDDNESEIEGAAEAKNGPKEGATADDEKPTEASVEEPTGGVLCLRGFLQDPLRDNGKEVVHCP